MLFHRFKDIDQRIDISDAISRVGGRASRVELNPLNNPRLHRHLNILHASMIRHIQRHTWIKSRFTISSYITSL